MLDVKIIFLIVVLSHLSMNAQLDFDTHNLTPSENSVNEPTSIFSVDIDNDGFLDVLAASEFDNKITWYKNTDGQGNFGTQRIISTNAQGAQSVYAIDIDNDGDMDVLSASNDDGKIAWYENLDGLGNFGPENIITENTNNAREVYSIDLDNDGDNDIIAVFDVSIFDGRVSWFENLDGLGNFGPEKIIATIPNWSIESIISVDIDNDSDNDVLFATAYGIYLSENLDGLGSFSSGELIIHEVTDIKSIFALDLNGDGNLDLLSASWRDMDNDGKIAWYENIDGQGNFGPQHILSNADYPSVIYATDIDGDGDNDVIFGSSVDGGGVGDKIAWHENIDGLGNFSVEKVISTQTVGVNSIFAADINGDNAIDILSASTEDDKLNWYKNINNGDSFETREIISEISTSFAQSVYSADINNDGNIDIISASLSDNKVAWFKNLGSGVFQQEIITESLGGASSVFATDMDSDGDIDVVAASRFGNKIVWFENMDGLGNFGSERVIATNISGADYVYCIDLDNDGDMDVLSFSAWDKIIAWHENLDGLGNFGPKNIIDSNSSFIYAADIDNDGDVDLLSASSIGPNGNIAWYENLDGSATFSDKKIIANKSGDIIKVGDIDNDGDIDVITGFRNKISWYENLDGDGNFGNEQVISTSAFGVRDIHVIDLDDDGDLDILSADSDGNRIAWRINLDGQGNFSVRESISEDTDRPLSVFSADIDNDGDLDVLSASSNDDKIAWHENLGEIIIGINQNTSIEFTLYPNPTKDFLTIKSKSPIKQIEVYNVLSQLVLSKSRESRINISHLKQGMYFCKIINIEGNTKVIKVIKE